MKTKTTTNPIKLRRRTKHIAEVYREGAYIATFLLLHCGHWLKTERLIKHPRCPKCEQAVLREMEAAERAEEQRIKECMALNTPSGLGVRRCSAALDEPRNTRNTRKKKGSHAVMDLDSPSVDYDLRLVKESDGTLVWED